MTELRHFENSDEAYTADRNHPNWKRWTESEQTAAIRGELVVRLLSPLAPLEGVRVLEIGCGYGGTALAFARRGCTVTATDADPKRIRAVQTFCAGDAESASRITSMVAMGEELPFENEAFAIVILQGVLEHTQLPQQVLSEVSRVLVPGGWTFLTVPNRFALFNLVADPHWGLPLIGIFDRKTVSFLITKILRREQLRPDFAELVSLCRMKLLLTRAGLHGRFLNKEAAAEMFIEPRTVTWTETERRFIRAVARLRLDRLVIRLASNGWGLSNFFLTPTWYIAAQKKIS